MTDAIKYVQSKIDRLNERERATSRWDEGDGFETILTI
jgi:hypothetical protein